MVQCPECQRPIISTNFKKCLYCGATFDEELLKRLGPSDVRQLDAMILIHRIEGEKLKTRSIIWARILYGLMSLVALGIGLWTTWYGVRKGPGASGLALLIGFIALAVTTFTLYKVIKPQPTVTLRRSTGSSRRNGST